MMSSPWNKLLRALLRFIVIRSNHDGGLVRTLGLVYLLLWWQKQEGERHEKKDGTQLSLQLQEYWLPFIGYLLHFLLSTIGKIFSIEESRSISSWQSKEESRNLAKYRDIR
ncbi:hypothetical protein HU200_023840 [Digitaria exilis]|uniref:Uncharacterized protein n=1 Tax=Digitaria exilis TaxID=1010633 RepID=A0A835EWF4_9POAL|nr:hypothetical protein HU200_023840 [Digitaria exilis]